MTTHLPHTRILPAAALLAVVWLASLAGAAAAGDAYLGITMSSLSPSMSRALKLDEGIGVLVDKVTAGSPADNAGLESGDVILQIDGESITGTRDITRILRDRQPGDELKITVLRESKQRRLKVTAGERPQRHVDGRSLFGDKDVWRWFSGDDQDRKIILKDLGLTNLTRGFLGVVTSDADENAATREGAQISEVVAGSPAAEAGLAVGDVIIALNGKNVRSSGALVDLLAETKPGDETVVRIARNGKEQEYTVTLASTPARTNLSEAIRRFLPREPDAPGAPWVFDWRRGEGADDSLTLKLKLEHEDLAELKIELENLKAELQRMRDELKKQD